MNNPESVSPSIDFETAAHKNFETNLGRLGALLKVMTRDIERLTMSLKKNTTRQMSNLANVGGLPAADTKRLHRAVSKLGDTVTKYLDQIGIYVQAHGLVYDWAAVMLVTFLEAYMEEGLVELARKNPKLLRDIGTFDWKRVFEIDSIEELRAELRRQWAQVMLRPGGTQTWVEQLEKLGAKGFNEKSTHQVQHLWDTRNLIVHAQGVAGAAYVKKYPNSPLKVGGRVSASSSQFKIWISAADDLVTSTEQFFLRYKISANQRA